MRIETIKKLCCPFDKADLELTSITTTIEGDVKEGFFVCKVCKRVYPIIKGVPIMNPDEYREFELEKPVFEKWQSYMEGSTFVGFKLKPIKSILE